MKVLKMMPMGAALLALGLGLVSVVPSPASARDEKSGTNDSWKGVRIVQEDDRDNDRDSNSGYLGVQVQRLTSALRRAKGIPESTEGTLVNNVERQIRDLQEQLARLRSEDLARLEREIKDLQQQVGGRGRDRDDHGNRNEDRDQDNNNDNNNEGD